MPDVDLHWESDSIPRGKFPKGAELTFWPFEITKDGPTLIAA